MENQYTLKIYPAGMGRTVYRVIEISGKETLETLCDVILSAYDFDDEHLYEFCMDCKLSSGRSYLSRLENDRPSVKAELDELDLSKGQKFFLHYDFGDDWMFTINVQKIKEVSEIMEPCVIKEKGSVGQYPDWDDFQ